MFIVRLVSAGIGLLLAVGASQTSQEPRYTVLPWRSVKNIPGRLAGDQERHGSWEPTADEISSLEMHLDKVSSLRARWWKPDIRIEHPERYFRQYIGVSQGRQRRIYINAFCDDPPPRDWHSRLYVVTDGATCYWQALFDPATKTFSDLTINGRA